MFHITFVQFGIYISTVIVAIYYYYNLAYSYWKGKNVKGPAPVPVFGNFSDVLLVKTSTSEHLRDIYRAWKHEPFVGLYQGSTPVLLVNDLDLIKRIFIKDFSTFTDRGIRNNEDVDPLSAHLFTLEGHRWRGLRSKLSPAFSSGKLKQMYHLLVECADNFEKCVDDLVAKGEPIECREITAKFTTDVIGSCAFGLNMNALSSEDSEFRKMGRKVFQPSRREKLQRMVRTITPGLFRFFKMRSISPEVTKFFMGSIAETVAYRKKNGVVRHDFVDLLIQIQANPEKADFELTDSLIAAQAFVFFIAGFETSSTTISYALYELAQCQDVQDKLRAEIQNALFETDNGQLPYEAINSLKYLDKVFQETMRKHPPLGFLFRQSVKDYTIPNSDVTLPSGTKIYIPVLGIHYDPEYYPDPEIFDPERFDDDVVKNRPQMTYLPFGEGPRNCIGSRFANYQTKIGLIKILKNYKISTCSKTVIPCVKDRQSFISTPVGGIYLNFTKL